MSERSRDRISLGLAIAAALVLVLAALVFYADRAFLTSDGFADRAQSSLASEPVRELIGEDAARAIIARDPDAVAYKPLIESTVASAVGSAPFLAVFRGSVHGVHRAVIEGDQDSVVFVLRDVGDVLAGILQVAAPELAKDIPKTLDVGLLATDDASERGALDVARAAHSVRILRWLLLLLALGLAAGAVAVSRSRRLGVGRLAWSIAAAGLLAAFALLVARHFFLDQFEGIQADAARAVWDEFMGPAFAWLLALSLAGVVMAAAAASVLRPVDLDAAFARAWAFATRERESTIGRVLHGLGWLTAGLLIVTQRDLFLDLVALAIGAGAIYVGAAQLMRLTLAREPEELPASPGEVAAAAARGTGRVLRVALVAAVLVGAGIGIAALVGGDGSVVARVTPSTCNGSDALCDRPLDKVAFAGTHNAMSAATNPNWLFAQQDRGIGTQLDDGIRALLIDTHYGLANSRGVVTDFQRGGEHQSKLAKAIGPEAAQAAERLRDRIKGGGQGTPGIYLCHAFCELGALDATKALDELRAFLSRHPGEVVLVSVEDVTSAADTVKLFEQAGLTNYIYDGPNGPPWPTLGELVRSGKQLVVMAENHGGEPRWLRDQFSLVKETPYTFRSVAALEAADACRPNRGADSNSIFLINHWVDTSPAPKPSNAKLANALGALRDRIALCRKERGGARPGILAVDFYREGDLLNAVDELNDEAPG